MKPWVQTPANSPQIKKYKPRIHMKYAKHISLMHILLCQKNVLFSLFIIFLILLVFIAFFPVQSPFQIFIPYYFHCSFLFLVFPCCWGLSLGPPAHWAPSLPHSILPALATSQWHWKTDRHIYLKGRRHINSQLFQDTHHVRNAQITEELSSHRGIFNSAVKQIMQ
jgi:hypothetical protein